MSEHEWGSVLGSKLRATCLLYVLYCVYILCAIHSRVKEDQLSEAKFCSHTGSGLKRAECVEFSCCPETLIMPWVWVSGVLMEQRSALQVPRTRQIPAPCLTFFSTPHSHSDHHHPLPILGIETSWWANLSCHPQTISSMMHGMGISREGHLVTPLTCTRTQMNISKNNCSSSALGCYGASMGDSNSWRDLSLSGWIS